MSPLYSLIEALHPGLGSTFVCASPVWVAWNGDKQWYVPMASREGTPGRKLKDVGFLAFWSKMAILVCVFFRRRSFSDTSWC